MDAPLDSLEGIRRATTVWRRAGIAVGLLVAGAAVVCDSLGRGLVLAVPLLGLGVMAGVLVGELGVRAAPATTRHAALVVRRPGDYVPRRLTSAVAVAAATLAALLVATTLAASPDDQGRAGRVLRADRTVVADTVQAGRGVHTRSLPGLVVPHESVTHSPWMGSYYSVPLALVVLVGLLAAGLTLHRIVHRSRPGDPAVTSGPDDMLRRRAARVVVGACGLLVTLPLLITSALTATGLLSITGHPLSWTVGAWALFLLVPVWFGVLLASAVAVLRPLPITQDAS